jgi:hypothetical protein
VNTISQPAPDEAIIDALTVYKAPGWRAFSPNGAVLLIGSPSIGWTKILTLSGPDRLERAQHLVKRYNAAPFAALPGDST